MIAPNYRARKSNRVLCIKQSCTVIQDNIHLNIFLRTLLEKVSMEEFEERSRGMVEPSQKPVSLNEKGVGLGLSMRGLRIVVWAGIFSLDSRVYTGGQRSPTS